MTFYIFHQESSSEDSDNKSSEERSTEDKATQTEEGFEKVLLSQWEQESQRKQQWQQQQQQPIEELPRDQQQLSRDQAINEEEWRRENQRQWRKDWGDQVHIICLHLYTKTSYILLQVREVGSPTKTTLTDPHETQQKT